MTGPTCGRAISAPDLSSSTPMARFSDSHGGQRPSDHGLRRDQRLGANYFSNSVSVVRAARRTGRDGARHPDRQRPDHPSAVASTGGMLVTNEDAQSIRCSGGGFRSDRLARWAASGACGDGINFWVTDIPASAGSAYCGGTEVQAGRRPSPVFRATSATNFANAQASAKCLPRLFPELRLD